MKAAHFIATLSLGLGSVNEISLDPPRCSYSDHTDAWHGVGEVAPAMSDHVRWRGAAVRALAGSAAEARLSGENISAALRRNVSDRSTAIALVELGLAPRDRNAVLADLLSDACALVSKHWDEILRVARVLQIHGTLYGFELERLVRRAEQKDTAGAKGVGNKVRVDKKPTLAETGFELERLVRRVV
jgi:hypothetical protein